MFAPDRNFPRAVIFGCSGLRLTEQEYEFFSGADPLGLILFDYNCDSPNQITALIKEFREAVGRQNALILIDQEGGRVSRLKSPHWRHPPAAAVFANAAQSDLKQVCSFIRTNARLIGRDLRELGITVNCAPVVDIPVSGAHDIIGDRALGKEANTIAILGRAFCEGMLDEGVLPVIKHMPGHGRARSDSHLELPEVNESRDILEQSDFETFRQLADMPLAMTAHIVFKAIDKNSPATVSRVIIENIIRGSIGFHGVILSDDVGMEALSGTPSERAAAVIEAGCDVVLECWGKLDVMKRITPAIPLLSNLSARRLVDAEKLRELRRTSSAPLSEDAVAALKLFLERTDIAN